MRGRVGSKRAEDDAVKAADAGGLRGRVQAARGQQGDARGATQDGRLARHLRVRVFVVGRERGEGGREKKEVAVRVGGPGVRGPSSPAPTTARPFPHLINPADIIAHARCTHKALSGGLRQARVPPPAAAHHSLLSRSQPVPSKSNSHSAPSAGPSRPGSNHSAPCPGPAHPASRARRRRWRAGGRSATRLHHRRPRRPPGSTRSRAPPGCGL